MPLESNFYAHDFTTLLIIDTCTTCTFFMKHLCIFQYFLCFIVGISFIFFHAKTQNLFDKEIGAFYKFTQLLRICHLSYHLLSLTMMMNGVQCMSRNVEINQKNILEKQYNPTLKILVTNNLQ